jgi:hypothetical protein
MLHLYKRAGNHWKTPPRFDRRESEQEEESQPLRKTGEAPVLEGHNQGQAQEGTLEVTSCPRRTGWPLLRSRTREIKEFHR